MPEIDTIPRKERTPEVYRRALAAIRWYRDGMNILVTGGVFRIMQPKKREKIIRWLCSVDNLLHEVDDMIKKDCPEEFKAFNGDKR